eukprot:Opistho-2@53751
MSIVVGPLRSNSEMVLRAAKQCLFLMTAAQRCTGVTRTPVLSRLGVSSLTWAQSLYASQSHKTQPSSLPQLPPVLHVAALRKYASSAAARDTTAPQETVKDLGPIKVTDAFLKKMKLALSIRPNVRLRLVVLAGGCHGFNYDIHLVDGAADPTDIVLDAGDGVLVSVEQTSLPLLEGSIVTYKDDLRAHAFSVLQNPNAEKGCGCGNSFSPK